MNILSWTKIDRTRHVGQGKLVLNSSSLRSVALNPSGVMDVTAVDSAGSMPSTSPFLFNITNSWSMVGSLPGQRSWEYKRDQIQTTVHTGWVVLVDIVSVALFDERPDWCRSKRKRVRNRRIALISWGLGHNTITSNNIK